MVFEKTVEENASENDIIEKIDIGGIALIRAAAKNFNNVFCISDKDDYMNFISLFRKSNGAPSPSPGVPPFEFPLLGV